jgi:hypothetical protein
MNEQQAKEFFNIVKDKAIRWTGWDNDQYFIPRELIWNYTMSGDLYHGSTLNTLKHSFYVSCGFSYQDLFSKHRWEFLPITDHLRESVKYSKEFRNDNSDLKYRVEHIASCLCQSTNIHDVLNIKESVNLLILDKGTVDNILKYILKLENENKLYKAIVG